MDIIPIQASSVPCEQAFSSGKETMAPWRRCISAKLMESLQMMKFSIWKGRPLNFTQGMRWKDELIEFEFSARTEPVGDPEAYGRSLRDDDDESDAMEYEMEKYMERLEELMDESSDEDDTDTDSASDIYASE